MNIHGAVGTYTNIQDLALDHCYINMYMYNSGRRIMLVGSGVPRLLQRILDPAKDDYTNKLNLRLV